MKITIEGAYATPRWETLQQAVRDMLDNPDGLLTRISRPDGKCGYREPGVYVVDFTPFPFGDMTTITLEVKP